MQDPDITIIIKGRRAEFMGPVNVECWTLITWICFPFLFDEVLEYDVLEFAVQQRIFTLDGRKVTLPVDLVGLVWRTFEGQGFTVNVVVDTYWKYSRWAYKYPIPPAGDLDDEGWRFFTVLQQTDSGRIVVDRGEDFSRLLAIVCNYHRDFSVLVVCPDARRVRQVRAELQCKLPRRIQRHPEKTDDRLNPCVVVADQNYFRQQFRADEKWQVVIFVDEIPRFTVASSSAIKRMHEYGSIYSFRPADEKLTRKRRLLLDVTCGGVIFRTNPKASDRPIMTWLRERCWPSTELY